MSKKKTLWFTSSRAMEPTCIWNLDLQEWIFTFLPRPRHSSAWTFGNCLFLLKSQENRRLSCDLESRFGGAGLSALLEPGGSGKTKKLQCFSQFA